jgi:hypothetical protein
MFRKLAPPIYQIVQVGLLVRAQTREKDLIMRRGQHVDKIELHQAELPNRVTDMAHADGTARARPVEPLRRQGDAPGLCQG